MIEINEEQQRQLESGNVISVTDPRTSQEYVVLRKEHYDRVSNLLYDDAALTAEEMRIQLARSAKENGWDEPGMEAYDQYDEEMTKRCR